MPFLSDDEIDQIVKRAVKKALRGNPEADNRQAVSELVGDGDNADDRSGGRSVQGGFAAIGQKVRTESERRRREHEDHVRKHGYVR